MDFKVLTKHSFVFFHNLWKQLGTFNTTRKLDIIVTPVVILSTK